ncbi:MAG: hypothetical protein QHH27_03280 [Clostridia bacterium]|nr:hypothetical protein [Clostridia bacterium]
MVVAVVGYLFLFFLLIGLFAGEQPTVVQPAAQVAADNQSEQQGQVSELPAQVEEPQPAPEPVPERPQSEPGASDTVPQVSASYEITELKAYWTKTSRGATALEGVLWVPAIKMNIKNTGQQEIEKLYLKALFLDEEGVITDEAIEVLESIPAGYTRGPVILRGSVGYTSSNAIAILTAYEKKWQVDLFEGESYSGPWKKLRSEPVQIDSSEFR